MLSPDGAFQGYRGNCVKQIIQMEHYKVKNPISLEATQLVIL